MKLSAVYLAVITLACTAAASPAKGRDPKGLDELAKKSGRYIGTATGKYYASF